MPDRPTILFVLPTGYVVDGPAGRKPVTSNLSDAVRAAADAGRPIAICVPSAWCLSIPIDTSDLARADAKAMLYRLEESLPLAAEAVVADFIPSPAGTSALGVCIRTDRLASLVDQLETAGVPVQSILPTALAAAQGLAGRAAAPAAVMLLTEPSSDVPQVNLLAFADGRPTHWMLSPATGPDLKLHLGLLSAEVGPISGVDAVDLDPELTAALIETTSLLIEPRPADILDAAAQTAGTVSAGRLKPWAEFRAGPLGVADRWRSSRRALNSALFAAAALMLSLTAALVARGFRYGRIEAAARADAVTAFREHFPGWEVPVNVRPIIDAQYRAMTAVDSPVGGRTNRSALSTLHDAIVPMTARGPMQVDRMSIHGDTFEVAGRVDAYDRIAALAKAARDGGMTVAPPQTRRDPDGRWAFVLQGGRPVSSR